MSIAAKLRRAPMRAVTGAFILNSGVENLGADEETAKHLHDLAGSTYGFVERIDPKIFIKALGAAEITLGGLVLAPVVPPVVAGLGLMAFSGAMLNMWWRTPGMHQGGSPRPTQQGTTIAKDAWLFGIGAGLVTDGLLEPAHDKKVELEASMLQKRADRGRRARKAARKAARSNREAFERARETAKELQAEAAKRLAEVRAEYGPIVAERGRAARDTVQHAVDEYGPIVAERSRAARDTVQHAVDEYRPIVAEKAREARDVARDAAQQVSERAQHATR